MSDLADMADANIERYAEEAIRRAARDVPPLFRHGGRECMACGQFLKDGRRFCDAFCRDDWQREMDAHTRNRGV